MSVEFAGNPVFDSEWEARALHDELRSELPPFNQDVLSQTATAMRGNDIEADLFILRAGVYTPPGGKPESVVIGEENGLFYFMIANGGIISLRHKPEDLIINKVATVYALARRILDGTIFSSEKTEKAAEVFRRDTMTLLDNLKGI
jgi:hypothetical protein